MRFPTILAAASLLTLTSCGDSGTTVEDPSDPDQIAAAAENIARPQPGEYRTTGELVEVDLPGASEEEAQAMRAIMETGVAREQTFCVTEEDAEEGFTQFVSAMQDMPKTCSFSEFAINGENLNATMVCDDDAGSTGNVAFAGTVSETGSDMTMTMDMENAAEGQSMRIVMRNTTERVGDCAA
ncbi:DUF3617 domain-containing protein [Aurantiacibacter aquimixticola]|uniref:DUF3617 domain-containing protein n=1 Tax=Aurantiacibacter aquimixticola TaxID=1958945 RepID=A0A419RQC2_9SPHN|nr:DUF3617 domain-containing protein [Aurantiacibacter aquimixticola]RJY07966.1 DUF3617 domain-containing protein [Aurantiacibacter aquimixticola]